MHREVFLSILITGHLKAKQKLTALNQKCLILSRTLYLKHQK